MANIKITRPSYSDQTLRGTFARPEDNKFKVKWQYRLKQKVTACKDAPWVSYLMALFPILTWLRQFNVRRHLLGEILAGLTIGFVNVPQGMAFAGLAHLDPYYGLYVAFFPVIVYIFMGSCHHQSWGGFGVTAIISGDAVVRVMATKLEAGCAPMAPTSTVEPDGNTALELSITIALLVGLIQCIMGFLRMGFISAYMSRSFIQALSTGAAFHVATSQLPTVLGLDLERPHGAFSIIKIWIGVLSSLAHVNLATLVVTLVAFLLLVILAFTNHLLKERRPVPIPMDMIVVVLITILSFAFKIEEEFDVELVGEIRTGFPTPKAPSFDHFTDLITDALAIALVTYAVNISLCKTIAEQHDYEIDDNQELLASGFANAISSFFSCYVSGPSLSRIWIVEKAGGRFLITSAVGCLFTLTVILALGQYLEPLPKAVLGVVLIFSLKKMIFQLSLLPSLYRQSKWDFVVWVVTFSAVFLLGVAPGLFVALVFSFFAVALRVQFPSYTTEGKVEGTELFLDTESFKTEVDRRFIVFHMQTSLCFLNALSFKKKLKALLRIETTDNDEPVMSNGSNDIALDDTDVIIHNVVSTAHTAAAPSSNGFSDVSLSTNRGESAEERLILINCASFSFVDQDGARVLASVLEELKADGVSVRLASCTESVHQSLLQSGHFGDLTDVFYPSLLDAYMSVA